MNTMTITQTKLLQGLLAIQKVYNEEVETLDIARDADGVYFLTSTNPAQAQALESLYDNYPVPLGSDFEEAKTTLLDIIAA